MSSYAAAKVENGPRDPSKRFEHDPALATLVVAAVGGDNRAWEALVTRFTPALRAAARGFKLSPADVDDVVQETWLAAVRYLDRLEKPGAIGAWLLVIARRESLRVLQRRTHEELTAEPPEPAEPGDDSPETLTIDADQRSLVCSALCRLPQRQRVLLQTLMSEPAARYTEIARRLEMPIGSIGPTRDRAIERLRRDRQLACVASEGAAC
jgi:RNA polymerase sigma factor (sigma-70 family)